MKLAALAAALFGIVALAAPAPPIPDHSLKQPHKPELAQRQEVHPIPADQPWPDFDSDNANAAGPGLNATGAANLTDVPSHVLNWKRGDTTFESYYCGNPWPYAPISSFYSGLKYLRGINKPVHMMPGPGNCGRVSCDRGAAVWVCNDWAHQYWIDTFDRVADALSFLIGKCGGTNGNDGQVAGQVFHKNNWNVIVRWDDDCKPGFFS